MPGKTYGAYTSDVVEEIAATKISHASDGTVGFYGTTPAARVGTAAQATITSTWVTISSGFGISTSAGVIDLIAAVQAIQHVLKTTGLWKGTA